MRLSRLPVRRVVQCLVIVVLLPSQSEGQTRQEGPWWPHPIWGEGDQAGASNWITPEKILEAVSLVTTGSVYELGHPYERGMPLLGQRSFSMFLAPGNPNSPSGLFYNDEYVCTELGQVGTQFDGLGHVGRLLESDAGSREPVFYNGITFAEAGGRYGLRELGVEKIKPYLTRGVLIDIAGFKKVDFLPAEYSVSMEDVRGALAAQGLGADAIRQGDAVFFNVGWSNFWTDPERLLREWARRPDFDADVVDWIIERHASLVGFDAAGGSSVHERLITHHGIPNFEFMSFDDVIADGVYEFMFVFAPLRVTGATGSPGRPLAIR